MSNYNVTFKGFDPVPVLVVFNNGVDASYSEADVVASADRNHLEIHFDPSVDKFKILEIIDNETALSEITISTPVGEIFVHLNYCIVSDCAYKNINGEGYRWVLRVAQLNETDIQLRKLVGKAVNDADCLTLDEYKAFKVEESKKLLAIWLASNPIMFTDGKYYSVTEEKQSLLNSNLASYERASAAEVNYPLKWNATGEECVPWEYKELLELSLAIAEYVAIRVAIQQAYEIEILACEDKVSIDTLVLDYDVTPASDTEEPVDASEDITATE